MSIATHTFPTAASGLMGGVFNLASNVSVLLIDAASNPYTWNSTSQAHTYVSDILGGSGSGALTEISTVGTGYARKALAGLSIAVSSLDANVAASNVSWSAATFTAIYAFFYETVHTTDATRRVLGYWDFSNQANPVNNGTFTLTMAGGIFAQAIVS